MSEEVILKVGLTPRHPCSYLGHEQEQLLVLMDHELLNAAPRLLLPPKPAFEQAAPPVKRQKDDTPA